MELQRMFQHLVSFLPGRREEILPPGKFDLPKIPRSQFMRPTWKKMSKILSRGLVSMTTLDEHVPGTVLRAGCLSTPSFWEEEAEA